MLKKLPLLLVACLALFIATPVSGLFFKTWKHPRYDALQSGDIVFQDTGGQQGEAVRAATGSDFTHCGVVFQAGETLYVLEAVRPLRKPSPGAKSSSGSPTTSILNGATIPSIALNWSGKSTKKAPESRSASPRASNPTSSETKPFGRSSARDTVIWTNSLKKSPSWLLRISRTPLCSSRFRDAKIGGKTGLCEIFHKVALRREAALA